MVPDAHTKPLATSIAATMKSAVSIRVSSQLLRILHLNYRTALEQTVLEQLTEG